MVARALVLLSCIVLGGGALAHHPVDPTALVGLDACVDGGSFSMHVIEGMPAGIVDDRGTEVRMRATWIGAMTAASVPWHEAATCVGSTAYLEVSSTVRYLDPATYVGFPEESVSYVYHAGVAPHPSVGEGEARTAFAAGASEVIGGSDEPGHVAARLHDVDRRSAQSFVQVWWTAAQPSADGSRGPSAWLIALAVMISTVSSWLIVVRSRRNRSPRHTPGSMRQDDDSAQPHIQEVLHVGPTQ